MARLHFYYSILILFIFLLVPLSFCELQTVISYWKNGYSAPSDLIFPNDPFNETNWPRGWGELTNKGILQMYKLGQFLRQRYVVESQFANRTVNHREVFIGSWPSSRSLESAASIAAGLFPPEENAIWNEKLPWQPVPVYTVDESTILHAADMACEKYDNLTVHQRYEFADNISREYSELYGILENNTGIPVVDLSSILNLYELNLQKIHDFEPASWINDVYNDSTILETINTIKARYEQIDFDTTEKIKFKSGVLLDDLLTRFTRESYGHQMILYSTDDSSLYSILSAIGLNVKAALSDVAGVIVELQKTGNDSSVQTFVVRCNSTDINYSVEIIKLSDCETECPLSKYEALLEQYRIHGIEEMETLCQGGSDSSESGETESNDDDSSESAEIDAIASQNSTDISDSTTEELLSS